jgi:hypothetical protein
LTNANCCDILPNVWEFLYVTLAPVLEAYLLLE